MMSTEPKVAGEVTCPSEVDLQLFQLWLLVSATITVLDSPSSNVGTSSASNLFLILQITKSLCTSRPRERQNEARELDRIGFPKIQAQLSFPRCNGLIIPGSGSGKWDCTHA
ncbi:conserved hypothetical protein [Ricinus communis]|uniref:Uncharacterized protein n=1 Tax=Ricinus communis TaxID=3988 RepID=B9S3P5_RICCO|nr:conserved hypothetical protein [Ricinus communis]